MGARPEGTKCGAQHQQEDQHQQIRSHLPFFVNQTQAHPNSHCRTSSKGGDILCTVDSKLDISRARNDARSLFQRDWCPSFRDLLMEMMRVEPTSSSAKFGKRFNVSTISSKQTASMFKSNDLDKDWMRLYKKHPRLIGLCDPYFSLCDRDGSRILIRLDIRRGSLSGGIYVVALKKTGKTWTVVDSCATLKI